MIYFDYGHVLPYEIIIVYIMSLFHLEIIEMNIFHNINNGGEFPYNIYEIICKNDILHIQ